MLTNAFIGKTEAPTDAELSAALGATRALWDQLVNDLHLDEEGWKSYSPKHGWSYRLKRGKRRIIYMVPAQGAFEAAFILGDKALAAARESKLPKKVLDGTRYPEGTGIRVEVKSAKELVLVEKLAAVKLAN
jgi:hypothetical protein